MNIGIVTLKPGKEAAWDEFVCACPEATFFHRAGWGRVIAKAYGRRCHYLMAERDGRIEGVLPLVHLDSPLFGNRLVSTAFTVGGGVAAATDEAREALDKAALALRDELGAQSVEFRQPARPHPPGGAWVAAPATHATFERHIAEDEDACLKQIPRRQRAVVRKAVAAGLTVEADEGCQRFFSFYAPAMRDMGTPVFGLRFFRLLMKEFAGDAECLTVLADGRPLASVLSFYFRDRVMPYYTGGLPEARALGANDFLWWRLMRRARERGFATFDYGRSKLGSGNYAFKRNWGFEPRPVVHEFALREGAALPDLGQANPRLRPFVAAWKRLPLGLANRLGPAVIRHIG